MNNRPLVWMMAALVFAVPATAATPAAPPAAAPTLEKDPASGVVIRGLMWRLSQTMTGRPVIATGYGVFREDIPWSDEEFQRAEGDIGKLQMIAAKNSAKDNALIPFKVGEAYVIAPEMRPGVNTDLSKLTVFDVTARGLLLADTFSRLTADQLKALGSENGLAARSLPEDMRRSVARAFRPPLDVVVYHRKMNTREDGLPEAGMEPETVGVLEQPLDTASLRIRARLRMSGAHLRAENAFAFMDSMPSERPTFEIRRASHVPWSDRALDLPIFPQVPNRFKPSDLTGAAYTQPLDISGVWTVQQVVDRIAKATGLTLSVWKPYRDQPVFLGAKSLRAGDVLDGLRLSLTASWRKMGSAYYLVWDRTPLLAISLAAREAADSAAIGVEALRKDVDKRAVAWRLVTTLPFDADDPLALTDDQRARLFPAKPSREGDGGNLTYDDLTSEQQDFLKKRAGETLLENWTDEGRQEGAVRTVLPEDLAKIDIGADGYVEVSAWVAGTGWVTLTPEDDVLTFSSPEPPATESDEMERKKKEILKEMPKELRDALEHPRSAPLPSAARGLVVPALGPARLNTLADEMQRHGLNVLFYPALIGGYATFPTDQFPPHPALRGADGLAAAVAAMKPKSIRVVAYLNTLAWQDEGDTPHWLDRYPEWLDVDALERDRLAWLKSHPDMLGEIALGGARDNHNYVRASEPRVEARLKTFVRELSTRREVSAVAFDAWQPVSNTEMGDGGRRMPSLGYAWADRLAAFRKTGADPADEDVSMGSYVPLDVMNMSAGATDEATAPEQDPHWGLLTRLLREAKSARKDWRVYAISQFGLPSDAPPAAGRDLPKPDLVITGPMGAEEGGTGLMLPVNFKTAGEWFAASVPAAEVDPTSDIFRNMPLVPFYTSFLMGLPRTATRYPIALLDFRGAPEIITDSLKWVVPPATRPQPVPPAKRAAPTKR